MKNKDVVKVAVSGDRALVFDKVVVRVHPEFDQSVQVDTDEGNAAGLSPVGEADLVI